MTKTHGMRGLEISGPKSLDSAKYDRLSDLRRIVATHPGRQELRQELAARVALLVEIGFHELVKTHEDGKSIWESPVIGRYSTYLAELRRVLETFPADDIPASASDVITQALSNDS